MGEQSVLDPPFSAAILGTYSCHGIEPSWEDENEVCAKTNQDRGCVVFPFMGDAKSVLCCVFDGHGEHGDAISNFSMLELPQRLTKHPKIITDPAQALKETFVEVDR
jgi:serine/threonine protein phosphatase PrpC